MVWERGPQGKLHMPSVRDGCYHGKVTNCCFLCVGRLTVGSVTSPIRYRGPTARSNTDRSDDDQELVGETIRVPTVENPSDQLQVDYQEGTIENIHTSRVGHPDIITVKIGTTQEIHIKFEHDIQSQEMDLRS